MEQRRNKKDLKLFFYAPLRVLYGEGDNVVREKEREKKTEIKQPAEREIEFRIIILNTSAGWKEDTVSD